MSTTTQSYIAQGDRTAQPALMSFWDPVSQRAYVIEADPATGAIPVTGTFTVTSGPVQYTRNGASQAATRDTSTPTNNRPLPVELLAGDSAGPVATGIGPSNSSTVRVHVGNASDIPVSVSSPVTSIITNGSGTPFTSTAQSGGKTSLDVAAYQAGTWTIPLPSGAATEATLSSIDAKTPALVSGRQPVDGSGVTQPVSAASLPLPAGAATETTVSGIRTRTDVVDHGASTTALRTAAQLGVGGAAASANAGTTGANTLRVTANITRNGTELSYNTGAADANTQRNVLATRHETASTPLAVRISDGAAFTTPQAGSASVQLVSATQRPYFQDFASSSLTTTYTQVVASTPGVINRITTTNNSEQAIFIATGAAASEVVQAIVLPGESLNIPLLIAAGTRIAIRTQAGTLTSGMFNIDAFA